MVLGIQLSRPKGTGSIENSRKVGSECSFFWFYKQLLSELLIFAPD